MWQLQLYSGDQMLWCASLSGVGMYEQFLHAKPFAAADRVVINEIDFYHNVTTLFSCSMSQPKLPWWHQWCVADDAKSPEYASWIVTLLKILPLKIACGVKQKDREKENILRSYQWQTIRGDQDPNAWLGWFIKQLRETEGQVTLFSKPPLQARVMCVRPGYSGQPMEEIATLRFLNGRCLVQVASAASVQRF